MEKDLEKALLEKLQAQEYEYINIAGVEDLKNNLKKQIEANNQINFEGDEFERLYKELINVDTIFKASQIIRDKFTFERIDSTKINLLLYNTKQWCKNTFQIANQILIPHSNTYKKYDITILINGFPMVQIELKNTNLAIKNAFNQITTEYKPSYKDSLFQYLQLFIISNGSTTKYFVNNANIAENSMFSWQDENNNPINNLSQFTETFLNKCFLSKIIARYIVLLQGIQELRVLRPYQIYAVETIVNKVENSNTNGYIWHTTGSGKTLTSFKASTILKDNPNIAKILFVVDRKDLDQQTITEFNKFQDNCVDLTHNTKQLIEKLQSTLDKDKLIVSTIQKLNNALSDNLSNSFKDLENQKVVFIFDECHRSTFGDSFKKIKTFFKKAQCFGFTGTPIKEVNASTQSIDYKGNAQYQTTASIFNQELHSYTIANAIADKSVLAFNIYYDKAEQNLSKKAIVDYIFNKHNDTTINKQFNAIFATNSIVDAIEYYKIFKNKNIDAEHKLKVVAIFSPPQQQQNKNSPQSTSLQNPPVIIDDLEAEKDTPDNIKDQGLQEIQSDYNAMYNLELNNYPDFYNNLSKRFKKYGDYIKSKQSSQTIDILIVVDMFLTGYDSPSTNTLYVDKQLKQHGLIQAFSRTNRLSPPNKDYAKIITFNDLSKQIDEAIAMYSANTDNATSNPFLTKTFIQAKDDLKYALDKFKQGFAQQNLAFEPSNWHKIKSTEISDSLRADFSKLFKEYNFIKSYEVEDDQKNSLNEIITKEELDEFLGVYKDLIPSNKVNQDSQNNEAEPQDTIDSADIEKYFESYIVDYDYIVKLLYKYGKQIASNTNSDISKQQSKKDIIQKINSSSYLAHQKGLLINNIDEIINSIQNKSEAEFEDYLKNFLNQKQTEIKNEIIAKYNANPQIIDDFISKYLSVGTIDYTLLSNALPPMGLILKQSTQNNLKDDLFTKYINLIKTNE